MTRAAAQVDDLVSIYILIKSVGCTGNNTPSISVSWIKEYNTRGNNLILVVKDKIPGL